MARAGMLRAVVLRPPVIPAVHLVAAVRTSVDAELRELVLRHPMMATYCSNIAQARALLPLCEKLLEQGILPAAEVDDDMFTFWEACARRGYAPAKIETSECLEQAVVAARHAIIRELAAAGWIARRIARFVYHGNERSVLNRLAKDQRRHLSDNAAVNAG